MTGVKAVPKVPNHVLELIDRVLFRADGSMNPLSALAFRAIPHYAILNWMNARGRYQLPTVELVAFLRELIGGRNCIEIGAGHGDVGRSVGGVRLTDSYFQTSDEIGTLYAAMGAVPINPPADVERIEAVEAVKKYRPAVCLACWVTQKYQDGDEHRKIGSCVGGVDELELLNHVGQYVFVGNAETHRHKRIFDLPHKELAPPWLVSRAHDQALNRIWIWEGKLRS